MRASAATTQLLNGHAVLREAGAAGADGQRHAHARVRFERIRGDGILQFRHAPRFVARMAVPQHDDEFIAARNARTGRFRGRSTGAPRQWPAARGRPLHVRRYRSLPSGDRGRASRARRRSVRATSAASRRCTCRSNERRLGRRGQGVGLGFMPRLLVPGRVVDDGGGLLADAAKHAAMLVGEAARGGVIDHERANQPAFVGQPAGQHRR